MCATFTTVAGGRHVPVTRGAEPAMHAAHPQVSPDGKSIAFVSTRDGPRLIYVMNADGSTIRRIANTERMFPHWSHDGQLRGNRRAGDTTVVYTLSRDGGEHRVVARIATPLGGAIGFPGDERFLYQANTWQETQLESIGRDGTDRRRLTTDHAPKWCPSISPDGQRIAVGRRDSSSWQIVMMKADGSDNHAVVSRDRALGSSECPVWSRDGRRLAFQSGGQFAPDTTKLTSHIMVVDTSGAGLVRLAPHAQPWLDETPSWFPDGKRIAFQSDRTGAWEIWVMNADGSEVHQLTR